MRWPGSQKFGPNGFIPRNSLATGKLETGRENQHRGTGSRPKPDKLRNRRVVVPGQYNFVTLPLFCPPSPEQGCRRGRRGRRDGQSRQESQRGKQVKLGQQRADGEGVRSRVRGVRRAWEAANENECEKSQGLEYGVP